MNNLTPYEVAGLDRLLDALEQTPAPAPPVLPELGEPGGEEEPERWDGLE